MTSRKRRRASSVRAGPAAPARAASATLPRINRWLVAALAAATMLAYVPALKAPFVLDDFVTVDAASRGDALPGMPTAGRPLVFATLAATYQVNRLLGVNQQADPDGPDKEIGYRLFNIVLHLLTGALLFGVVRRAMREEPIAEDWRAIADPVAGVVTALWLLHPIQTEVINYVVQRSEGLGAFFYVGTLYASQRAWSAASRPRVGWYAVAVTACILGMLSKEIVISAPLAVMLYDRAFRLPSWRALVRPGGGRGFLYVALWAACLGTFAAVGLGARGDSAGMGGAISWYAYLYTQCWAISHYLRLVVWPTPLSLDYGFRPIDDARGVPGAVLLTAFGIATIAAWARVSRFGWFAFLGSIFFLLLAPSSSVVPIFLEVAAERRMYLALAVVIMLGVVSAEWARRRVAARVTPRWALGGATAIALLFGVTTAARSRLYNDPAALWRTSIRAMPGNSRAYEQLGLALFTMRPPRLAAAESAFVKALAMDPSCNSGCLQYGMLLSTEGRYAEAIPLLERKAAEGLSSRYTATAGFVLAFDYMKVGSYDRALPYLERIAQLQPNVSQFVALGVAYLSLGRKDEAIATFRHMATLDPGNEKLQRLSARLEDGVHHPEALANLQEFALGMARGWL